MTVTPDEIVDCYGKRPVKDGVDQCSRRKDCPWGEACLSCSREKLDADHYHIANVSVGFMVYDPGDDDDQNRKVYADENAEREAMAEKAMLNLADDKDPADAEEKDVELEEMTIPGMEYDSVILAIAKIAELYFSAPSSFDMLMKSIFQGKNQADAAREKGITRQGLNKRLLYELGIAQKRNDVQARRDRELAAAKQEYADKLEDLRQKDEFFRTLSDRDWKIYRMVFVEGKSYQTVANEMGIHRQCVYRVVTFLRSKLTKNVTFRPGRKPHKK